MQRQAKPFLASHFFQTCFRTLFFIFHISTLFTFFVNYEGWESNSSQETFSNSIFQQRNPMIRKTIVQHTLYRRLMRSKHTARDVDIHHPTVTRECLISTQTTNDFNIPLSISDVHLRNEQLPFAYFFDAPLSNEDLEASLIQTLPHFAPAGGTILNYQSIECTVNDTVPLTFTKFDRDMTLQKWLDSPKMQNHHHVSGNGDHPILNPLFQPLFTNDDDPIPYITNLMTIQVTQFAQNSGTSLGINIRYVPIIHNHNIFVKDYHNFVTIYTNSHLLGDTASCIRFAECWGNAHLQKVFSAPCFDRSALSCSGMITQDILEIMDLDNNNVQTEHTSWWSGAWFNDSDYEYETLHEIADSLDHQYVKLRFAPEVLDAMKDHAMDSCKHGSFVSTNDTIMAASWLLKRMLSKIYHIDLSIVVNLRGKCGLQDFDRSIEKDYRKSFEKERRSGLFGNGITNIIASVPPTSSKHNILLSDVSNASIAIRKALIDGIDEIPNRISHSRSGQPIPSKYTSSICFSATSWRQFPPQAIRFSPDTNLICFHGQPSHPLPQGSTYSTIVHSDLDNDTTVELFLPSHQIKDALQIHSKLCEDYIEWYENFQNLKKKNEIK